jgi:hypothetical protein
MPADRNRRHIDVVSPPKTEDYTPHGRKIPAPTIPSPPDRRKHARHLRAALLQAEQEAVDAREASEISVHGAHPGLYIQFQSAPGVELALNTLEDQRRGIEIVAVQTRPPGIGRLAVQLATVFVPHGKLKHFIDRFQKYADERTATGEPRHKDMVDRIATLRRATVQALWTDAPETYPAQNETICWEVWLRRHDGKELARLYEFAAATGLEVGDRRLAFDDRIVLLVTGTAGQLSASIDVLNDIAELRQAKDAATFFVDQPAEDQADWIDDLVARTTPPGRDAPAVCVLDTGVTRAHPLLDFLIDPSDATAVDATWGAHDDGGGQHNMGHGTEMAGLAAYGDLTRALAGSHPVAFTHRLESVKILPPRGANDPKLYGAITAQAVSRPEITAPERPRTFSLAITASDQRDRGQPTSWSAAIDALAAGRIFDPATQGLVYLDDGRPGTRRLFVISAGNVEPDDVCVEHLERSDLECVHDPAQAWNALTVGAHTEHALITDPKLDDYSPIARAGDLSPWSTTSVTFNEMWPLKPDVVFEGGNVARQGTTIEGTVPDLAVLTTYYQPHVKLLVPSWATSAATAQVARLAAMVQAEYPDYWPETVRALIVHSARWTPTMDAALGVAHGKRGRAALVRRYGFGVPSLSRALRSANDALTLVLQATLHPYADGKMRELHLHKLPWPKSALAALGETPVRLRVTLSYFVEPNPGRLGWKKRHSYASHALRFDVKGKAESADEFRKRLNKRALDEGEGRPPASADSADWFLGDQTRHKGSLHSDIWFGMAADLAEREVIGVFPVGGWWREQKARDRSHLGARYALAVSVETDAVGVDIWTPVAVQLGVPIEVTTTQ